MGKNIEWLLMMCTGLYQMSSSLHRRAKWRRPTHATATASTNTNTNTAIGATTPPATAATIAEWIPTVSSTSTESNDEPFALDAGSQWHTFREPALSYNNDSDDENGTSENHASITNDDNNDDNDQENTDDDNDAKSDSSATSSTPVAAAASSSLIWQCRGNRAGSWLSYSNSHNEAINRAMATSSFPITINVIQEGGGNSDYVIRHTSWGTLEQYSPSYGTSRELRSLPAPSIATSSTNGTTVRGGSSSMASSVRAPPTLTSYPTASGIAAGFASTSRGDKGVSLSQWCQDIDDDTPPDLSSLSDIGSLSLIPEFAAYTRSTTAIPATIVATSEEKKSVLSSAINGSNSNGSNGKKSSDMINDDMSSIERHVSHMAYEANIANESYKQIIMDQQSSLSLLLTSFHNKSRSLVRSFDTIQRPLARTHNMINRSLRTLLHDRHVQALVSVIDNHRRGGVRGSRFHDPSSSRGYDRHNWKAMEMMGRYRRGSLHTISILLSIFDDRLL
jgi:hypothetical protein